MVSLIKTISSGSVTRTIISAGFTCSPAVNPVTYVTIPVLEE